MNFWRSIKLYKLFLSPEWVLSSDKSLGKESKTNQALTYKGCLPMHNLWKPLENYAYLQLFLCRYYLPLSNSILLYSQPWWTLPQVSSPALDCYRRQLRSLDEKFLLCLPTTNSTYDPKVNVGRRSLISRSHVPGLLLDLDLHPHLWLR